MQAGLFLLLFFCLLHPLTFSNSHHCMPLLEASNLRCAPIVVFESKQGFIQDFELSALGRQFGKDVVILLKLFRDIHLIKVTYTKP